MSDVDAIRNLSDVATKLQTSGKLILPGDLTVQGKIATNDLDPSDMPVGWTGGLRFIDGYASGNMGFGPNKTTINAQINKDGNINFVDGYVSGNMNFGPNDATINAQIKQSGDIEGYNLNLKGDLSFINDTTTNVQIKQSGDIIGKNLNVNGKIITNDLIFTNGFTTGNMAFGPNDATINAQIKQSGDIEGYNLNLRGGLSFINAQIDKDGNIEGNTIKFTGGISGPNIMIKNDGSIIGNNVNAKNITTDRLMFTNGIISDDMVFGPNAKIDKNGNIEGKNLKLKGKIVTNDLNFTNGYVSGNMVFGPNDTTVNAKINKDGDIEGNNLKLKGNLIVNDILIKKNRARIIRVGNINSTDVMDENSFKNAFSFSGNANATSTTSTEKKTDKSLAAEDFWSLIEIRVFDDTGINRAANGTVKQITGKPNPYTKVDNIIDGSIISINKENEANGYIGDKGKHLLEINLGDEYNISQIQLFNRHDPIDPTKPKVSDRMNDTIVELISDLNYKTVPQVLYLNRRINTGLWDGIYYKEFIL